MKRNVRMPSSEKRIQDEIRLAASDHGMVLWRNSMGQGWMGRKLSEENGYLRLANAYRISFGIGGKGGSDLIGYKSVTITPDMVGQKIAQWVAVEVKSKTGRLSKEQRHFLDVIEKAGGIALIARSPDDLP